MKKVSIILFDWSVRESFHAIDYLNRQTICKEMKGVAYNNGFAGKILYQARVPL